MRLQFKAEGRFADKARDGFFLFWSRVFLQNCPSGEAFCLGLSGVPRSLHCLGNGFAAPPIPARIYLEKYYRMQALDKARGKNGENGTFCAIFPCPPRKNSNFWLNSSCQRRKLHLYWIMGFLERKIVQGRTDRAFKSASGEQGPGTGYRKSGGHRLGRQCPL